MIEQKHEYKKGLALFQVKPVVLIAGANGWIGCNAVQSLQDYQLILTDYHVGADSCNRFGLEKAQPKIQNSEKSIVKIDLATEREKFVNLLKRYKPHCVLHFAGILENQAPTIVRQNIAINRNVLEACAEYGIPVIAASSIMVMYGAAISREKTRAVLAGEQVQLTDNERISIATPYHNNEETVRLFYADNWPQNLAYIQTKEEMETLSKKLVQAHQGLTIVNVRFGWTGIKNPYELEGKVKYSETTVYLDVADLQRFLQKIVIAVLTGKIKGYKCYACISVYPDGWVNQNNTIEELAWSPQVNIIEKYKPTHELLTVRSRL